MIDLFRKLLEYNFGLKVLIDFIINFIFDSVNCFFEYLNRYRAILIL